MNTLARCCQQLHEGADAPVRVDLGCMALPAGKDILAKLLESLQGTTPAGELRHRL